MSIPSSFAASFADFSPRMIIFTAGMSVANSGGGQSRGILLRQPGADTTNTLGFNAQTDVYFHDTTYAVYLRDTAGNITRGTATIGENGWAINFAVGDVNATVRYLVEVYGYSRGYNQLLSNNM